MYILGICTRSIEELEGLIDEKQDIKLVTFFEFYKQYKSLMDFNGLVIVVDSLAKLLLINDIKILETEYFNKCWRIRKLSNTDLSNNLKNLDFKDYILESVTFQCNPDINYDLNEFNFITYLTDYNKNSLEFCIKLENIYLKSMVYN